LTKIQLNIDVPPWRATLVKSSKPDHKASKLN
jgi:hypothetical protein